MQKAAQLAYPTQTDESKYHGGKLMQASHDKRYPRTTGLGAHLKIKGRTVIRVYRVKE